MQESRRPGGLTVLAVASLILAVIEVLGVGANVYMVQNPGTLPRPEAPTAEQIAENPEAEAAHEKQLEDFAVYEKAMKDLEEWDLYGLYTILRLLAGFALFVAGLGYLKMRRVQGRGVGNVYVLLSIAWLAVLMSTGPVGQGMSIGVLIALLLPVLTLILVNTVFREDLVR